jgi:hypothetical protein
MHEPFCACVKRPIRPGVSKEYNDWHEFYVLGLGSTGVSNEHRATDNVFGALKFGANSVTVSVHPVRPTKNEQETIWSVQIPRTCGRE